MDISGGQCRGDSRVVRTVSESRREILGTWPRYFGDTPAPQQQDLDGPHLLGDQGYEPDVGEDGFWRTRGVGCRSGEKSGASQAHGEAHREEPTRHSEEAQAG